VEIKNPKNCSQDEIRQFAAMVTAGGEVDLSLLNKGLMRAYILAFEDDGEKPVAVGALKNPLVSYKKKIFTKSSSGLNANEPWLEMGWFYTIPEARKQGHAFKIMKALCSEAYGKKVYATVRSDNKAAQALLNKAGFKRIGEKYASTRGNYELSLFICT